MNKTCFNYSNAIVFSFLQRTLSVIFINSQLLKDGSPFLYKKYKPNTQSKWRRLPGSAPFLKCIAHTHNLMSTRKKHTNDRLGSFFGSRINIPSLHRFYHRPPSQVRSTHTPLIYSEFA